MDAALDRQPGDSSAQARASADVAWRHVAFLLEASRQLAGSLNVRRTVLRSLRLAVPYLGEWVMLAIFEGRGATFYACGGDGVMSEPVTVDRVPEDSALWRIGRVGRTELLHVALERDPEDGLGSLIPDEGLRAAAATLRPADVLGVGLNARGSTAGALVAVRAAGAGYDEPDVEIAEEFARHAAMALDSARLYEERVHTSATLQASLRPPELPVVPGARIAARYRAAHAQLDIGGDFYDVHGEPGDTSVVVGDVCGKGVEAAVLTGKARQTIKTAARFDRSPASILAALNDVLYADHSDRFVTVACVRVRPGSGGAGAVATVAVAGHPPPLVLRRDGTVEEPDVSGTLSGVLPDLSYRETEVWLAPGDAMLLYTDGVYEARGRDDFFGQERLRELLPGYAGANPETLCEVVEQRVVEHLDGAEHDDIALLALRIGD
ncbi:PP2C family protein-serine/threonine phosphatase [Prauserella cavernicola]|uniref:SpoIIE family protein phosphatase n=1 Tax=Prauserella cavernicola TaxID=2800127 RepID=A0A934QT30_9PSEU|nr:SpoIIE family protein phosphatase [Prauserella cavernicola]MBK1787747.1 SpoIIE family protein phosphatase [Prauserella cavernicola]